MDVAGWAAFGFAATVLLSVVMAAAQLAGWTRMDIPLMLGTVFVSDPDRARVLGFGMHLLNGQLFALFYATAFALIGRATWWLGAIFGLVHGIAAVAVIVPLLPGLHPRMATDRTGPSAGAVLEPPGAMTLNYGRQTALVAVLAHVMYGLVLGVFLGPR